MTLPLLVTAAIIENDQKFLLIKRARAPFKNSWCFIGGCGAFNETSDLKEAVKLEVLFDINCKFNPIFLTYNQDFFEVPTLTFFFYGKIEGVPQINPEGVLEYGWFNRSEMNKLELGFDHKLALDKYLKRFFRE